MFNEFFSGWVQMWKPALAPAVALQGITSRYVGECAKFHFQVFQDVCQASSDEFEKVGNAKGVEEIYEAGNGFVNKMGPRSLNYAQKFWDMSMDSGEQYRKWFEATANAVYQGSGKPSAGSSEKKAPPSSPYNKGKTTR